MNIEVNDHRDPARKSKREAARAGRRQDTLDGMTHSHKHTSERAGGQVTRMSFGGGSEPRGVDLENASVLPRSKAVHLRRPQAASDEHPEAGEGRTHSGSMRTNFAGTPT